MSDAAKYDELRLVLDELNHLGTPNAITQRLARLEFRSAPGEAYPCTLAHYLEERRRPIRKSGRARATGV
jgi:hypothetical protein